MFRHRHSDEVLSLNTTSTADISFMLLIFFLVTSSMDTDKGLFRQLPPAPQEQEQLLDVKADDVLIVRLDANDRLTCQGDTIGTDELTERVVAFVKERGAAHVVSVRTHRSTTYNAYFQMQQALVKAYARLHCQQRISEEEPEGDKEEGGATR